MKLALWAAALSGVQVGAGIVASRFAVVEVPPLTLALLRYAIGFACLLPFALVVLHREPEAQTEEPPPSQLARDLGAMAALGMVQFGVLIALLNWGLLHVGAASAALIFSLFPLLTMLLSAVLGRERIALPLFAGVLLSIGGVALSLAPKLGQGHSTHWWGELAVFASACLGALCSVLYRPYLRRYPTVPVSAYAMLASVFLLALLALGEQWPQRLGGFGGAAWAAVAFIGVSSGIGYFCWLYALKHESPTRVTAFLALNPVTAALLGWALLHEPLPASTWGALGLIGAGLWLATRGSPR
jgi:drug/metabolite transporter (DMT)-like permease